MKTAEDIAANAIARAVIAAQSSVNRKETVVRAILDLHLERALASYPVPQTDEYVASAREHVETYRVYAEQEADVVLAALDNLK